MFRDALLSWYDAHRRDLPWRARDGEIVDPYRVWLSEIMLQQTTVQAVKAYFLKFIGRWPTVQDLAAAPQEDVLREWAGLGYYARARNLHRCAQVISAERGGIFPADVEELKKLPGIGAYTAAAITAIAFDKPATVVDANVERVVSRLFAVPEELPFIKPRLRVLADLFSADRVDRPGDFAQGMMDLGATICTPKSPRCIFCPVRAMCRAFAAGNPESYPRKAPKKEKPQKYGYFYWITDGAGRILLERRPESGMLGGMPGLPTSAWEEKITNKNKFWRESGCLTVDWDCLSQNAHTIRHSFTHFDLTLEGCQGNARNPEKIPEDRYFWVDKDSILSAGLPTLFLKAVKIIRK